jgi:hypothetical protein
MKTFDFGRGARIRLALRLAALSAALLVAGAAPQGAHAQSTQSGIQLTPDARTYLINKFVPPNEQWAIAFNPSDGTSTGNVFKTDGSAPSFVWCRTINKTTNPDPARISYTLECFGADACVQAPCNESQWRPIATSTITGDFLLPDGTRSTFEGNVQPIFSSRCALVGCHDSATASGDMVLAADFAYAETVDEPSLAGGGKIRVDPFNVPGSYLFDRLQGIGGALMPLGGPALPEGELNALRDWILEGAVNN